jgi:hypothetical protein
MFLSFVQMGHLDVVVPPDFVNEDTSGDVMVPEGGTVKLTCRARGYPIPHVLWRREDNVDLIIKEPSGVKTRGEFYKQMCCLKNAVYWDVMPCRSYVNRHFGGTYCLHLQGRKIRERGALGYRLQPSAHAGSSLADFSTLKMEAIRSSETSVYTRSTRHYIPEDGILHSHRREILKSYKSVVCFGNFSFLSPLELYLKI